MNGNIHMEMEAIQQNGQRFKELANDYKDSMLSLQAKIDDLATCWNSSDHDVFVKIYEENKHTIDQMGIAFEEFGSLLEKTSVAWNNTSSDLKGIFGRGN